MTLTYSPSPKVFCRTFLQKSRLFPELNRIKVVVESVLCHKRFVIAQFDDVAVFHYENNVGFANGGQAVRNDKRRFALCCGGKRILNFKLGAGVDGRGCLVKYKKTGVNEQYSGNAQKLLVPLLKVSSVFFQNGVVAVRQASYKRKHVSFF